MLETGIESKHRRHWFEKKPPCTAHNDLRSVTIEYAAPLFIIVAIGIGLSASILVVEILLDCFRRKSGFVSNAHF